ncbi:hypothetical protein [Thermomonas sp. HDW16]|uniref:hypothetical protein n=1 Tax=Thermomonas sp. HDW16 TaxID=2714945 RepID=UPI0014076056|nr:hypothetical protein [Thermomonas sp. HDW16]QIL19638.1 hypothetical protein G7079_02230 [Thermomonas sp. HDW16]
MAANNVPPFSTSGRGVSTWAKLQRALLQGYGDAAVQGRIQGILGVVNRGTNPRSLIRRIAADELDFELPETTVFVLRTKSGRGRRGGKKDKKEMKQKKYLEIPIDLVEAGERLCPGSSHWEDAYLWRLAGPVLPGLEEIRVAIFYLKHRLGFCSPSPEEHARHLTALGVARLSLLSESEMQDCYAAALVPIAKTASADALSLLAALLAESFITNQKTLLRLHRNAFHLSVETLLSEPLMMDIGKEFRDWITDGILDTAWEQPAEQHISSLSAPLIPIKEWEAISGQRDMESFLINVLGAKRADPPWHSRKGLSSIPWVSTEEIPPAATCDLPPPGAVDKS